MTSMLSPYRVIDCSGDRGELAGFMLAALGAEVIAVEPPEGSPSRHRGPFAGGVRSVDTSLQHWAYARGKRSVVLDLRGSADDRDAFRRLVEGADVLIEAETPGVMASLGLGYTELSVRNEGLVYASISPFGQDGPKATWAATDLTVWAASGPMVLTGDADRAPIRPSIPQAFAHAGAEAAGAIIAALFERSRSGRGQQVDVSAQQSCMQATQSNVLAVPNNTDTSTRGAGGFKLSSIDMQALWPCKDGYVSITFFFGTAVGPYSQRLMEWVHEEGFCDQATRDKDWIAYGAMLVDGREPVSEYRRVCGIIGDFCMAHTKSELLLGAVNRRLLIAPIAMMDDVVGFTQFAERSYWQTADGVRYPGPFAKFSETPMQSLSAPRPLGADTEAVLEQPPRVRGAEPVAVVGERRRPLDGVKILDFMWVMAGPASTRVLADLGATVVRVESGHRIETARTLMPFRNGETGTDSSCLFANLNAGKLGISVDPTSAAGREVILDLVRWADVVTESFSPKAMKNWNLGYEQLREVNPSIVMVSSCLFGQSGSFSQFAGYGAMASALSGFFGVTGWPDRVPAGPYGAYSDYIAPRFGTAALLAALDHRRRTGQGQYIDFAQAEAAIHALSPAILQWTVNGEITERCGNDDLVYHPHGVFPSAGDDRWVAIACTSDPMRSALESITGGLDHESIAAWTRRRSPDDATAELQSRGVAAHAVQNSAEVANDPQLAHRRHFRTLPHPVMGEVVIEGPRFQMYGTPLDVTAPGPTLGQHTVDVLTTILGYGEERIVELLGSDGIE